MTTTTMTIWIISGEGEQGRLVAYDGTLSVRALKRRLTSERCGGDRWARVEVESADMPRREVTPEDAIAAVLAAGRSERC